MTIRVLAVLALLGAPAWAQGYRMQERDPWRPGYPRLRDDHSPVLLDIGSAAGFTTLDGETLWGAGLLSEVRVRLSDAWFLFAQGRQMTFDDDDFSTFDLFGGFGADWPLNRSIRAGFRAGAGAEWYEGERSWPGLTVEIDGSGPLMSFQGHVRFRIARWLDLETGAAVEVAWRIGFDLEDETDVFVGGHVGAVIRF